MAAGDLLSSFVIDPANTIQGGVGYDSRVVFILKNDLASYSQAGINPVTALTLAANKAAFSFDGIKQSLKPRFEKVEAESGQSVFRHVLEFMYFDYSQLAKENQKRLANGRYVGIAVNAKQDANAIEIYGLDVGLQCQEMVRAPQENGGATRVVMASPEKEYEAKPPQTLDGGTGVYATNIAIVEALLFLPTIGASGLSITTYPAVTPTAIVITGTNFFGGGTNSAVTGVALVNQATGTIIAFSAALTVASTTITTTTPATGEGSGKVYKVRVRTTKGECFSTQNIITT